MKFSRLCLARSGPVLALLAALLVVPGVRVTEAAGMNPPANPKEAKPYKKLVLAAREYLDLHEDAWSGRKAFETELLKLAKDQQFPLASTEFLQWLVAQSRSFEPPLNDRKWAKKNEVSLGKDTGWGYELKGGERWAHIREPNSYVDKPSRLENFPRPGPWPTVLAMHRKRDPDHNDGAGKAWLQANWDKKTHRELFENWFVLMPIVAAAKYEENGVIRPEKFHSILRDFWKSYHMDFDRVVIDGATDALRFAVTNGTVFLSGVVLRDAALAGDQLADAKLRTTIQNIEHMPIYVVNKPKVAKALKAAGLKQVVEGDGKASMVKWMSERRRTVPKKFKWHIGFKDQQVGYWVNVDQPLWDATERFIEVDISDKEPNVVDIKAIGVSEMSLFLDDTLVNLDEPVKVRINGTLMHDAKVQMREKYAPIKRDPKEIFEQPPVDVRKHRYYGWLKPASIVRMTVPLPKKEEKPVTPQVTASPKEEADAAKLMGKAESCVEREHWSGAIKLIERILKLPFNKQTEKARALKTKVEEAMKAKEPEIKEGK